MVIEMEFTSNANSMDIGVGIEGAYDAITSSFGGGVDFNYAQSELGANSEITLLANGGDPQIAAAISDFSPQTHKSATFRADLQAWIKTVPLFPRVVERIPKVRAKTS